MASPSTSTLTISSSSPFVNLAPPLSAAAPPQSVTLPTLPPPPVQSPTWKTSAYCRKIARNVMAMVATGEAPVGVEAEVEATELPEIVKTVQEAWEKVEDKFAVTSLGVACVVGLVGTTGMISAIDRLPLIPSALELVGIGYSGWFAYTNLVNKPKRDALIMKIKSTYQDIIGTSS